MSFLALASVAIALALTGGLLVWLGHRLDLRWMKPGGTLLVLGALLFVMQAGDPGPQSSPPDPARTVIQTPSGTASPEPSPAPSPTPKRSPTLPPGPRGGSIISPSPPPPPPPTTPPPPPPTTPPPPPPTTPPPSESPSPEPSDSPSP
jgi:hypothetical protein